MLNEAVQKPFVFKTRLSLVALTGFRARDITEFRDCLKQIPASSIYYHTHHFLQQHQFLVQEPPNDFASWVTHELNEVKIGERLAAIDTVMFRSLEDLRLALVDAIDSFLSEGRLHWRVPPEQEFYFMKAILYTLQTPYSAGNLTEFLECLKKISIDSLYFHLFEARLRNESRGNDFSSWLAERGEKGLAREINRLDPYSQTMEDIRRKIAGLLEQRLREATSAATF